MKGGKPAGRHSYKTNKPNLSSARFKGECRELHCCSPFPKKKNLYTPPRTPKPKENKTPISPRFHRCPGTSGLSQRRVCGVSMLQMVSHTHRCEKKAAKSHSGPRRSFNHRPRPPPPHLRGMVTASLLMLHMSPETVFPPAYSSFLRKKNYLTSCLYLYSLSLPSSLPPLPHFSLIFSLSPSFSLTLSFFPVAGSGLKEIRCD